jgi:uncharacterized membrane protein YfcA
VVSLSLVQLVGVGAAAIAAGAVNALAGGGTLITFPVLTAMGVPAISANITNTVALSPGYLGGTLAQREDLEPQRARIRAVALPAVLGGVGGGTLLLITGADAFRSLVPWLILLATALVAIDPVAKRWVRSRSAHPSGQGSIRAAAAVAFLGGVYGGFFGAGLGIVLLGLYAIVVPQSLVRTNALKQFTSFLANTAAALFFVFSGHVVWIAAVVMAGGALLGGATAGKYVRNVRPDVIRAMVVMIGLVVAVVYFLK